MKRLLVVLACAMCALSALAFDPPPLPTPIPPQDAPVFPPAWWAAPSAPAVPLTLSLIGRMPVSTNTYREMLAEFSAHYESASSVGIEEGTNASLASAPNTVTGATLAASADIQEDREPSIATISNAGGTLHTVVAYIRAGANSSGDVLAVRSANFGAFASAPLPYTSPRDWSWYERRGDPVVAGYPYSTGYNPYTVYAAAALHHYVNGSPNSGAIGIWGMNVNAPSPTWCQVATIAETCCGENLPDKPSIAVSLYQAQLGWVWAAAVNVQIGYSNTIVAWADQGTGQWAVMGQIPNSTGANYQSPQVMVDPSTGYVYVVWLDWGSQQLFVTRTTDRGATWATPKSTDMTSPGTHPILGPQNDLIFDTSGRSIQARTMISARFNAVDNTIGVVWHRREGSFVGSGATDIVFRRFVPNSVWANSTWGTIVTATTSQTSARDQWNPGLDFSNSGQYMVSHYSKYDDYTSSRRYKLYASKLNADGSVVSTDSIYSATIPANPTPVNAGGTVFATLGEYKDVWYWQGTWYAAFEYIPDFDSGGSGRSDIYVTKILP